MQAKLSSTIGSYDVHEHFFESLLATCDLPDTDIVCPQLINQLIKFGLRTDAGFDLKRICCDSSHGHTSEMPRRVADGRLLTTQLQKYGRIFEVRL